MMEQKKGKIQEIKYSQRGEAFIRFCGSRYLLSEFMKTDKDARERGIHGICTLCSTLAIGIWIDKNGDYARAFVIR